VTGACRFAGYPSPQAMLEDPTLTPDDKMGGLRTWRGLILRVGASDPECERRRLLSEIDRVLALLSTTRPH